MNSFITSFGLPAAPFKQILKTNNCLMAGSSALSLYLQQEGIEPGFSPGDIDIWVEDTRQLVGSSGAYHQFGNRYIFINFLVKNGFNVVYKYNPKQEDYKPLHHITEIISFMNREGKEVQVILLNQSNLLKYIRENFDLSICMSWWDPINEKFENMWPEETLRKEMLYYPTQNANIRESERIEKYKGRGFRLIEHPCSAIGERDQLIGVDKLEGQLAFDTISYDEVDCATFLRASSWHVLLQVGDKFQAFHRRELKKFLKGHGTYHPDLGVLYDTPHRQTILDSAKMMLSWSDYSIVSLVPAYNVTIGNNTKSLYECRFYTVEQWTTEGGLPGIVREVPLL